MRRRKWLTDDEQRAWVGLRASMARLDAALDEQLQRDSGISHATYAILAGLSQAPGRMMHMSDLALFTNSSQSRLSHAVARLEQLGWVTRARCPENKRQVDAHLTDAGYEVVRTAAPGHVRQVRELVFDSLSADQVGQLEVITEVLRGALTAAGYADTAL